MTLDLTVIILTCNEELHIKRCIENALKLTNHIIIVDSGSNDNTVNISRELGASVMHLDWPGNHAEQLNNALNKLQISSQWLLRLDADEYLSDELLNEISNKLPSIETNINGFYLKRRNIFLGKELIHGGMSSTPILRLWRNHYGKCDNRLMDEQIIISEGFTASFDNYFYDNNLSSLTCWSEKHLDYAYKEALQSVSGFYNNNDVSKLKRMYNKMPLFVRPFLFFIFRYFFLFGFLDGKSGLIWHVLQGFWYRFLVDAQIYKINMNHDDPIGYVNDKYPKIFK